MRTEQNRDLELLRFRRGELQLIEKLTADMFDRLASETPGTVVDAGPTLDSEFLWFNESRRAPIGDGAKEWFQSRNFRRAISLAIHRDDLGMRARPRVPFRRRTSCGSIRGSHQTRSILRLR